MFHNNNKLTKVSLTLNTTCIHWNCKQDMTAISSDKKRCVRCSVLGLCFQHRRVRQLTTLARARLTCPSAGATLVCEW